jgi:hypothetical protein
MSVPRTWRYQVAHCQFKETRKAGLLSGVSEGQWVLVLDREYPLAEGLNRMGDLGYELAGIQLAILETGGRAAGPYAPASIYVFKRPVDDVLSPQPR